MKSVKFPCIICCARRDLNYLFEYSLRSAMKNVEFINEIFVITPDPEPAKRILDEKFPTRRFNVSLVKDREFLSRKENDLCGWSKQQILKLRSDEITRAERVLSIGADTVILQNLFLESFYSGNEIIVNYRQHSSQNVHRNFEARRVKNIYKLLKIQDFADEDLKDYIFDVFLFDTGILTALRAYLKKSFGNEYFSKIFPARVNDYSDMNKIGEWSLYTVYLIEILGIPFVFKDGSKVIHQIHTQRELESYDYAHKAVHFVRKDFDKSSVFMELMKRNIL